MATYSDVTGLELLGGYRVRLTFADGTVGDVDLEYLVGRGPVFNDLRDLRYFMRVRVDPEGGTIVWPNGADVAPETLYAAARGQRLSA